MVVALGAESITSRMAEIINGTLRDIWYVHHCRDWDVLPGGIAPLMHLTGYSLIVAAQQPVTSTEWSTTGKGAGAGDEAAADNRPGCSGM